MKQDEPINDQVAAELKRDTTGAFGKRLGKKAANILARRADIVRRRRRQRDRLPSYLTAVVIQHAKARLGPVDETHDWREKHLQDVIEHWLAISRPTPESVGDLLPLRRGRHVKGAYLEAAVFKPETPGHNLVTAIQALATATTVTEVQECMKAVAAFDVEEGLYKRLLVLFQTLRIKTAPKDPTALLSRIHALVLTTLRRDKEHPDSRKQRLTQLQKIIKTRLSDKWLLSITQPPCPHRAPHEWAKITAAALCGVRSNEIEWADKKMKEYSALM